MVFIEGFKSPQLSKPSNLQVGPLTAQRHSFYFFSFFQRHSSRQITTSNLALVPEQEEECQDSASYHQTQNNCFIIPDLLLTSMEVLFSAQGDRARAQFWARVHCLPINCLAALLPFFTSFALSKRLSPNSNPPLSSGLYSWDSHCLTLLEVHLNPIKTKLWEYIQEKECYVNVWSN